MKNNTVYFKSLGFFQSRNQKVNIDVEEHNGFIEVKTSINSNGENVELDKKVYTKFQLEKMLKMD